MKKASSKVASKVREVEPFDKRTVDLTKFKLDLSAKDVKKLLGPIGSVVIYPFGPIETLSLTRTLGLARTNLTLVAPTVFQTDAAPPRATFDRQSQARKPAAQMHFQPSGYGITSNATYIMEFTIQTFGQCTFNLVGNAGLGTVLNQGTKVLNGPTKVSLVLKDVPPNTETFGFIEQQTGGVWNWFSIQVRFPDLVLTL